MAAKKKIAIDICNTLVDINSLIEKEGYRKNRGSYYYDVPKNFFKERLDVFLNAKPFNGACDALWRIAEIYDIVYITARPLEAAEVTKKSLFEINNFPPGKIIHTTNKVKAFRKEGCCVAIEDAPDEIYEYIKAGITVYIHSRDYNTSFAGYRFISWESLFERREVFCYG